MEFLYLLEKLRMPGLNEFMLLITRLGEETAFLVLAVKEGLRSPLEALLGDPYPARLVRYFLIVLVAGLLWPMSFRFFSELGCKKEKI